MRRSISVVMSCAALGASAARAQDAPPDVEPTPAEPAVPASEDPRVERLERRVVELESRLARAERADLAAHGVVDHEGPRPTEEEDAPAPFTIGGWVEAYYAFNFNNPENGITDLRGFDNRHHSFNLSNVAIDAHWDYEGANGRITLQWGSTPATYYLAETNGRVAGTGVGAQSIELWQYVQQAYAGYRFDVGGGLNVQAGLFLSPIGAEGMSVKDNWFYSRSNLFYGFPFYHTGVRVAYAASDSLTLHGWLINGWNTVLDNNREKSVLATASLKLGSLSANLSYLGGVERSEGAPEGEPWRHLLDLNGTFTPTDVLALQAQLTGGFEPNDFGTSAYFATALAVRVAPSDWLALSARGDVFYEKVAEDDDGRASAIFWPVEWVSSATLSVELKPHAQTSFRIEYRHDQASSSGCDGSATQTCAYFRGNVEGDGVMTPFVRDASSQDTITLGATAWF